jgi:hypothetical protein
MTKVRIELQGIDRRHVEIGVLSKSGEGRRG